MTDVDVVAFARSLGLTVSRSVLTSGVVAVVTRAEDGVPELHVRDDDRMLWSVAYGVSLYWRHQDKTDLGFIVRDEHAARPCDPEDVRAHRFATALVGGAR